jgi:riboflavin kinase/FMN adenylyltransferase
MQVWSGTAEVPPDLGPTSVTVGSFDGVHAGHRMLLDRVVADRGSGLLPVAVTFWPHPMVALRPMDAPLLLSTAAARLELLAGTGLAAVLVLPFTEDVAAISAERFATSILANTMHARHVVVGGNFRFGHRASGDVPLLRELGRELGFEVTAMELAALADGRSASSTAIRAMVAAGDVRGAAAALRRFHRVSGAVCHGDHRGRQLGFPTANIAVPDAYAVPADGVYAGWLQLASQSVAETVGPTAALPAPAPVAVSVGTNPTFQGRARRVEAYVLDAPAGLDLYDREVDLDFVARLRDMQKFDSVADLVAAMKVDVAAAREILAGPAGQAPA